MIRETVDMKGYRGDMLSAMQVQNEMAGSNVRQVRRGCSGYISNNVTTNH